MDTAEGYEVPDGWEWTLVDVECGACGAPGRLHEQPPAWLETPEGVAWECSTCHAHNRLGGVAPVAASDSVAECGECHATFNPNAVEIAADGSWTCPACETANRSVALSETASAADEGA